MARKWREPAKERASAAVLKVNKTLSKSFEQRQREKKAREIVREQEKSMMEEARAAREAERQRIAERRKRREENRRKSEIVQEITNTNTLMRMKKRGQLKKLQKR